jgi:hypothetical protein
MLISETHRVKTLNRCLSCDFFLIASLKQEWTYNIITTRTAGVMRIFEIIWEFESTSLWLVQKNAAVGGALTGALLSFGDYPFNQDKMIRTALTASALATATELFKTMWLIDRERNVLIVTNHIIRPTFVDALHLYTFHHEMPCWSRQTVTMIKNGCNPLTDVTDEVITSSCVLLNPEI